MISQFSILACKVCSQYRIKKGFWYNYRLSTGNVSLCNQFTSGTYFEKYMLRKYFTFEIDITLLNAAPLD